MQGRCCPLFHDWPNSTWGAALRKHPWTVFDTLRSGQLSQWEAPSRQTYDRLWKLDNLQLLTRLPSLECQLPLLRAGAIFSANFWWFSKPHWHGESKPATVQLTQWRQRQSLLLQAGLQSLHKGTSMRSLSCRREENEKACPKDGSRAPLK